MALRKSCLHQKQEDALQVIGDAAGQLQSLLPIFACRHLHIYARARNRDLATELR